jgi:molybdenum-dependent DNA-binding transcriptional regulator ModE
MELRQLKHFLAVGEAGSITAAAKSLRLTQPALSRQIKALAEVLDTTLLERGGRILNSNALDPMPGGSSFRRFIQTSKPIHS